MIPYLDLKTQYRAIKDEIDDAIQRVLDTAAYTLGPEVEAFEREFAEYSGATHGIGVASGTSALHVALLALDIGPGDEVITTPSTFVATIAAIRYTGAKPVFVDIDADTCNIDPERIEAAITPRTKAVLPVHLYGRPAEMPAIRAIAERHGIAVLEDAAQAHGAELSGVRAGSLAPLACFSMYPGKNLGAYGDAGMIVTSDDALAQKCRLLRNWGQKTRGEHAVAAFNYRMDGFHGAVLRVKLRYLEAWTEARNEKARRYDALLAGSAVKTPLPFSRGRHAYHVYAIRSPARDYIRQRLADAGVETNIHYTAPIHLVPAHADLGHQPGDFPNAEALAKEELSLPIYPELEDDAQKLVAEVVRDASARALLSEPERICA